MKRDAGFSLIELALAILILSIGTLAALRGMGQAQDFAAGSADRAFAQIVVRNRAEALRLSGGYADLPATETMARRTFDVAVEREATAGGLIEATITAQVQGPSGAGAILVVYLPVTAR